MRDDSEVVDTVYVGLGQEVKEVNLTVGDLRSGLGLSRKDGKPHTAPIRRVSKKEWGANLGNL